MYNCSKSAVEALYETLKVELAPFNIRTAIIEPGVFRTGILTSAPQPSLGVSQHYQETVVGQVFGLVGAMLQDPEKHIPGEPSKLGDRVVEFVDGTGMGRDAVELAKIKMKALTDDFEASYKMAMSTDYEGHTAPGVGIVASL
jgi:NAD(P)-dependent dehydrogenase (short-subunit alcohol dehydrogenase family)